MKAVCWHGTSDVRVETVPDPKILNPRNAILKVTSATICGSDLHIYDGFIPTMKPGDIIGHEFMGEVVDIGSEVKKLQKGVSEAPPKEARVVVSSIIPAFSPITYPLKKQSRALSFSSKRKTTASKFC